MDTLPLPPRPHLAQYRKRAKELVEAAAGPENDAVRHWATGWLEALARLRGGPGTPSVQESLERRRARHPRSPSTICYVNWTSSNRAAAMERYDCLRASR